MSAYTEAQIREQVKALIETNATGAVVFPWWVLGHKPETWPGLLRSANDGNKVHGYVITRTQTDGERDNPQCVTRLFTYEIWGFYTYTTGTSSSNSDLTFNAEIDAICDAFEDRANLDEALARAEVPNFKIDLDLFGGELLHYARGTLVVEQV